MGSSLRQAGDKNNTFNVLIFVRRGHSDVFSRRFRRWRRFLAGAVRGRAKACGLEYAIARHAIEK